MRIEFSIWILAFIATLTMGWATLVWARVTDHIKDPYHAEAGAVAREHRTKLQSINERLVRIENKLDVVLKEHYENRRD